MLRWLAQFLTAPIVSAFLDAYKAKLAAANAQGAQAAELARAALLAEIEARKGADAIIVAEQGRWYTAIIRPLLAAPVIIYLWKVIVWDIVLGLGSTDPIGGDVAQWAGSIVTAYVGGRSLEKIRAHDLEAPMSRSPSERLAVLKPSRLPQPPRLLRITVVQSQRRDECRPAAGRNAAARFMPAHGLHGLRPDRRRCAPGLVSAYQQAAQLASLGSRIHRLDVGLASDRASY